MSETRCGYVALIGAPNAGKSTLMNQLVGSRLAIVTPKPQTTRTRITGILTHEKAQLIVLDVPGVFDASEGFEQAMVKSAWRAVEEADIAALVIDAERGLDSVAKQVISRLSGHAKKPSFLILNKVDAASKPALLEIAAAANALMNFEHTFMISALRGDGVRDVRDALIAKLPVGPWLFPEDQLTTVPLRFLAAEITREKVFMNLRDELPYHAHVETEKWEERKDGGVNIHQVITVTRESHKKIVIGHQGSMLKKIGEAARLSISSWLGRKAHLVLFIKVEERWKHDPEVYSLLGLPSV